MVKRGQIPLLHYVMDGATPIYDPVPWFDGVSYNILHQEADPEAGNPLIDLLERNPDFRPPAPAGQGNGFRVLVPKAKVKFNEAALRASVAAFPGKAVPGRAVVADVLDCGAMAHFIATHDFHVEGALPSGRKAPRGVALYAVYTASGRLSASHRATIAALRESGHAIVLINSTLAEGRAFLAEARPLADIILLRANGGRDFASWMAAAALLYGEIAGAEHWVFANDSLLGPVADTAPLWRAFAKNPADIWALTESLQQDRHLQSSFFILRRSAFQSAAFLRYLSIYGFPEDRIEIVRQGEIAFSAAMRNSALKTGVMVPYERLTAAWLAEAPARQRWLDDLAEGEASGMTATLILAPARPAFVRFAERWLRETEEAVRRGTPLNPQHHFWDSLVSRFSYPFIKRDLLTLNPLHVPTVPRVMDLIGTAFRPVLTETLAEIAAPAPAGGTVLRVARDHLRASRAPREKAPVVKAPVRRRERVHA